MFEIPVKESLIKFILIKNREKRPKLAVISIEFREVGINRGIKMLPNSFSHSLSSYSSW